MAATTAFTVPTVTSSTNLGPLTTSFSFPSNCVSDLYDFSTFGLDAPWTYETQGCALSTCCPSNNYYTVGWGWFSSYYSPGVCPSDYHSCAPYTGLSKAAGETIIFCCLNGYSCPSVKAGDVYYACASLLSTTTIVTVLNDIFEQHTLSTRTFSNEAGQYASYQIAYPIQIRFKSSELTSSGTETWITTVAAGSQKSTLPEQPSAPTSTPAAAMPTHTKAPSSGLSQAAKIGIGVGLGVSLSLAIVIIVIWFVSCSRRRRNTLSQQFSTGEPIQKLNPEANSPQIGNKPELDGQPLSHLETEAGQFYRSTGDGMRAELSGLNERR